MSLYPQPASPAFGQMAYTSQPYSQPMLPQAAYHYPAAVQPVFHVDPNMFRRDYMARLAELTVNSRPIIQNLSMIAQEYSRFAEIVAQCIESHIRRVSPAPVMCLPHVAQPVLDSCGWLPWNGQYSIQDIMYCR